jgi:hypothetical protein
MITPGGVILVLASNVLVINAALTLELGQKENKAATIIPVITLSKKLLTKTPPLYLHSLSSVTYYHYLPYRSSDKEYLTRSATVEAASK